MRQQLSTLPMLLNIIKKRIMDGQLEFFEQFGLSKQHIPYIIMLFNNKEGLTQKEMVDFIKLDKAHASRALKELIELGCVYKADPNGYKSKMFLTVKGLKLASDMKAKNITILDEVFSVISEDEKKQLEQILKKVVDHIDDCHTKR